MGDRATEVAVVLVEFGRVVDRFQSLMNPGVLVSPFIAHFNGITNAMLAMAPDSAHVMAETSRFVGRAPLVAHNAAFDAKFWRAELQRVDLRRTTLLFVPSWCRGGCTRKRPATN